MATSDASETDAGPPEPTRPATSRADRVGLSGYGCLVSLMLGGFLGGCWLIFLSVSRFMDAAGADLTAEGNTDTQSFIDTLEGSVAAAGGGAVLLLVAIGAGIVLLKELGDESARRARGPVRPE